MPVVRAASVADFSLKSATDDSTFSLSRAKTRFVALHFLLKTECPFCLRHTREYTSKSKADGNVTHVFIKPDSEAEIWKWVSRLKSPDPAQPTIYRDPDADLAKALGVPDGYQFHGQTVHFPALILIDSQRREVFRHVGKSNTDRLSYAQFESRLRELEKTKR